MQADACMFSQQCWCRSGGNIDAIQMVYMIKNNQQWTKHGGTEACHQIIAVVTRVVNELGDAGHAWTLRLHAVVDYTIPPFPFH